MTIAMTMTKTQLTKEQQEIQPRLQQANINPASFLATDYLNHYNEIVMLLEMVPDMPDIAEDTYEWAPKSYPQHFLDSGFAAKDLAVEAYELAPTSIRKAFDITCQHLDDFLVATVSGLKTLNVAERGLTENASMLIKSRVQQVQEELAKLNAIIHGKVDEFVDEATSKTIIAAKESTDIKDDDRDAAHTQEEIDALFD